MIEKPEDILTTGEAAVLCGVSRSTLRRAVGQGQIVAWHTPGRHLRFTRAACLEFARSLGRIDLVGRAYDPAAAGETNSGTRAEGAVEASARG
jgi:excisionase family DNA binding protein